MRSMPDQFMSNRQWIDLGQGERVLVSYSEFKARLSRAPARARDDLLRKHFPEEVAKESKRELDALNDTRIGRYLAELSIDSAVAPYWLTHDMLIARARTSARRTEKQCDNTVGHFTSWIYGLRFPEPDTSALLRGLAGERAVQLRKFKLPRPCTGSEWRLLHSDPLDGTGGSKRISLLEVNGRPLTGRPDYVLEHIPTKSLFIVEVKVTDKRLYSDGWPNLKAQLWAYSLIDEYVDRGMPIVLVGEVWNLDNSSVRLRQTLRWSASDPELCARNEELFALYRGSMETVS